MRQARRGAPRPWPAGFREKVRRYDGVPGSRLLLMPYGIPLAELNPRLSRQEARERLGLSGGDLVMGVVGRLEEQKGHTCLLAALPALQKQIPDLMVLIVGEGREEEKLKSQVRALKLANTVRFLGTRRDLPEIYRALDLFVHPSLWEGLPLALLKAMGAGLPVVATRVSGSQEAIEDGVNGCLVAPGDPEALARAILELHRHPEMRQRLGDAARRTVAARYSLEAMLQKLADLYLDLWRRSNRI
jgi:glycosyltransferase involved in cell wall biosynthesis